MTNKQKSILYMLISAFGFSLMGVFVKLTGDIPVIQKAIFRTSTIMIFSFIMLRVSNLQFKDIKHHKLLLMRSILGTVGILLNYYALDNLILSDANTLFRLSTVFLIIFCWIFLNEKLTLKQLLMIIVAFIGVVFIMKPALNVSVIPYLVAILGAAFAAGAYTTLRALGGREHPLLIVFYFSVFTTVILGPYVILNYTPMSSTQLVYAILAGLCAGIGQVGVTVAYKLAPAKEVSIYNYFSVIFSGIFSIIIFDSVPDGLSIIGYIIIFGTSYYMYKQNN
ncbi:DMT family transporter [Vallitalea okinawensis]|uniref:DMT family transporter n=1 Tax=Vallitalea okinawensis TaxID=2078660 RepID=UPI000CFD6979|nr:DMT family transporter [Vallitalea okinawensis]